MKKLIKFFYLFNSRPRETPSIALQRRGVALRFLHCDKRRIEADTHLRSTSRFANLIFKSTIETLLGKSMISTDVLSHLLFMRRKGPVIIISLLSSRRHFILNSQDSLALCHLSLDLFFTKKIQEMF